MIETTIKSLNENIKTTSFSRMSLLIPWIIINSLIVLYLGYILWYIKNFRKKEMLSDVFLAFN